MTATTVSRIERDAARAFQAARSLRKIAAILNMTEEQAAEWLDSDRLALACATIKRANAHPRKKKDP